MHIQLLPENIAARIAAGEVVERPASVIKELVENSLDAHATRLLVETRAGGQALMRVQDNGDGIPAAELPLAFRRHATSKLVTADDLQHIATLGFRGEALASIASVSRVTCTTRHREEPTGLQVRLEAGNIVASAAVGRPPGTEMLVEDLFYNTPARRKFLRAERTERRHIDAFLTRYAIAYPQVAFTLLHDGHEILSTAGRGDPRAALVSVYGLDLAAALLDIPASLTEEAPIRITGYVGPPTVHRADRGYITLFINGRWVQDLRLTYAVIQAYHTLLPGNRYPVAFVALTLPAEDVDVNVHPAKTEVRFHDGDAVFRAVQRAVRATIIETAPVAASWESGSANPSHDTRRQLASLQPTQQFNLPTITGYENNTADTSTPPNTPAHPSTPADFNTPLQRGSALPMLRVIGQIATTFIIAEGPDGLYLIDQHAAHERVLYEQLLATGTAGQAPSQPLLEPLTVTLPADEAGRLETLLPTLAPLGLEIEVFGSGTFLVRATPAQLPQMALPELLADIAALDGTEKGERSILREALEEQIVRRICKRSAIKGGQVLSRQEMEHLVILLEQTENPRTCPHGRPTVVQITVEQLARQFGRL